MNILLGSDPRCDHVVLFVNSVTPAGVGKAGINNGLLERDDDSPSANSRVGALAERVGKFLSALLVRGFALDRVGRLGFLGVEKLQRPA